MPAKPDTVFLRGAKKRFYGENRGTHSATASASPPRGKGNWRESLLSAPRRARLPHRQTAEHVEGPSRDPAADCRQWLGHGQREASRATGSWQVRQSARKPSHVLLAVPMWRRDECRRGHRPSRPAGTAPLDQGSPATKRRVLEARRAVDPDQRRGFGSGPPALGSLPRAWERPRNPPEDQGPMVGFW